MSFDEMVRLAKALLTETETELTEDAADRETRVLLERAGCTYGEIAAYMRQMKKAVN